MREDIRPVSRYRIVACVLATLLTAVSPSAVNAFGLWDGPHIDIPPPGKSATQLDSRSSRYPSGDIGYGCARLVDSKSDCAICSLVLPCALGLAVVQNDAIAMWGIQFSGPGKPQCATTFFFSQIGATLTSFAEIFTMRSGEIINEMTGDAAAMGATASPIVRDPVPIALTAVMSSRSSTGF